MKDKLRTMPLSAVVDMFFDGKRGMINENTVERYRTTTDDFTDFFGDPPFDELTIADWRSWRGGLFDRDLARPTVESYIRVVRNLYNWLEDSRLIDRDENLAQRLRKPKMSRQRPKAVRVEDIKKALQHLAYEERWGLKPAAVVCRDRAIVLMLADTGCRVGGLCSITKERLDLETKRAIVAEKGKGGKDDRLVFFGGKTQAAVKDWLYFHPVGWEEADSDTPLFTGLFRHHHGEPLDTGGVYQALQRLADECGIKNRFNPHSFRHAAAREWLRNGADLSTVSQLLGHTNIDVTARFYAVWAQEELAERHEKVAYVDNLNGGRA